MNICESIIHSEVIEPGDDDVLVCQIMTSSHDRKCERCPEIELVPGTLIEVHHGPGCHEGYTELLCKSCHGKETFDQGYRPEELRKKDRSLEEKCAAGCINAFNGMACLYPDDPSVTPFITQQRRNLEVIHKFNERADAQARTLQRKMTRFGCDKPSCEICGEADFRVLTDKVPKGLNRFGRRTMKLKRGKTILCQNCFAKLPFAQIYWAKKFEAKGRFYLTTLPAVSKRTPSGLSVEHPFAGLPPWTQDSLDLLCDLIV